MAARVNPRGALELLAVAGGVENAHTCGDVALVVTAGDEGVDHTVCGFELVVDQACGDIALNLLNVDGVLVVGDGLLVFLELTLGHLRFSSSNRRCGRSLRGCRPGGRLRGSSRRARCCSRIGGRVRAATRNQHDNRQDDNNQQSQRATDNTPNLGAGEWTLLLGAVLALTCVWLTLVGVVLVLAALDVLAALETLALEALALVLTTLEVLALETISLVRLEDVRSLTCRDELCVLVALYVLTGLHVLAGLYVLTGLHVLAGLFREVHGALGFGGVELNERGALDSVGILFGGGGCLSCGSLSDRFRYRWCLGGNLGDGINNNGLGNDRLRSGRFEQCGLGNRSLNNVRLNGQRRRNLGGLLSLNSMLSSYGLSNLLSGSHLSSGILGNQRLNSSLFNLNGFRLGLFDPQLPTFRNGTPRGVRTPRRSGGPSGRRSGPVGRRIEDECHKKAAFLVLKKHPGRAVISDYVYERIIATNYGIGSENEPREWWVFSLIHGFFTGFETFRINQYLKVTACPVTIDPAEARIKE